MHASVWNDKREYYYVYIIESGIIGKEHTFLRSLCKAYIITIIRKIFHIA